jgi:hypothetical protein
MVRRLRNSWAPISRLVPPSPTSRMICSSWGVSWLRVEGSRLRAVSPVARSSAPARSAHGAAPSRSKVPRASRRWVRASRRRLARRSVSP